jgi:hypothetical protein
MKELLNKLSPEVVKEANEILSMNCNLDSKTDRFTLLIRKQRKIFIETEKILKKLILIATYRDARSKIEESRRKCLGDPHISQPFVEFFQKELVEDEASMILISEVFIRWLSFCDARKSIIPLTHYRKSFTRRFSKFTGTKKIRFANTWYFIGIKWKLT